MIFYTHAFLDIPFFQEYLSIDICCSLSTLVLSISQCVLTKPSFNAGHRCSLPGCGHTLVIDGNMKIHRNVCAAKDAGFTRFDGLPGSVKTGCMNTPEQKGVFCEVHKVRGIHGDGVPPSLCLMITGHRATRTGVLYQVH